MRNRLLASVALCAVAVLGAGTPTLLTASTDVSESQELVDLAGLNQQAIGLSHALADERDSMVEYIGAGRTSKGGAGVSEAQRSRVDRQVAEVRSDPSAPASVKKLLSTLPTTRQQAIGGRGKALETYERYTAVLQELQGISGSIARGLPGHAQNATADALPDLGRAVGQASAVRGLLRGALAGSGFQPQLTAEAQRANVREQGALADFDETAGTSARETLGKTVTGTDVATAERYVGRLTDRPYLQPSDRLLDRQRFETTVSARIDRMRGVQASFAADEVKRLEKVRDDDVTDLELLIVLVGVCLLVAAGAGVQTARSMARPLSVLRRGSQRLAEDPAGEDPVVYNGKNDEFAEVVRSLNALRATAASLQERATEAEADNNYLVNTKDELVNERERLRGELRALQQHTESMSGAVHGTFVNLSMRTLGLVERQLGVIEGLEEQETDPDRLGTLFKLDHLATRMRRHGENLLLLAGSEHGTSHHSGPVPLLDVLRAAVSEIERYERVELGSLPPHVQVSGHAADDVSHLAAELLDNATSFSPPESRVQLSGWLLESGEVMLSVQDEGIGLTEERLEALNSRLENPGTQPPPSPGEEAGEGVLGMGLYVVAQLAARQDLRVHLRRQQQGGVAAVVTIPSRLLPSRPAPVSAQADGGRGPAGGGSQTLPGSVAEANSNALPPRRVPKQPSAPSAAPAPEAAAPADAAVPPSEPESATGVVVGGLSRAGDPMVAAAEEAVRKSEQAEADAEHAGAAGNPAGHGPDDTLGGSTGRHAAPGRHAVPDPAQPVHPGEAASTAGAEDLAGTGHPVDSGGPTGLSTTGTSTTGAAVPEDYRRPYGDDPAGTSPDSAEEPQPPTVTDKGLPKRRPKQVDAQGPAQPRRGGADAEELRRRLGGFQKGAQSGRRDVAAETAEEENVHDQSGAQVNGGTAEEARN